MPAFCRAVLSLCMIIAHGAPWHLQCPMIVSAADTLTHSSSRHIWQPVQMGFTVLRVFEALWQKLTAV